MAHLMALPLCKSLQWQPPLSSSHSARCPSARQVLGQGKLANKSFVLLEEL